MVPSGGPKRGGITTATRRTANHKPFIQALQSDLNDLLALVLVVIPRCVMHPPETAVHLPIATDGVTPRNNAQHDQSKQKEG